MPRTWGGLHQELIPCPLEHLLGDLGLNASSFPASSTHARVLTQQHTSVAVCVGARGTRHIAGAGAKVKQNILCFR